MESGEVKVGFRAPESELPEPLTGKTYKLDDFEDQQGLLVMFICNHCPFVIHLKESIAKFAEEFHLKGLGVVVISSNSVVSHPQDGPEYMAEDAKKFGYVFPYLYDETQEVAKAYDAVCTPDFHKPVTLRWAFPQPIMYIARAGGWERVAFSMYICTAEALPRLLCKNYDHFSQTIH